jgi:hypothetical protein
MAQYDPIPDPPRPEDRNDDHAETQSESETGELSFDDLPFALHGSADDTPFVRKLQERVETALRESEGESPDAAIRAAESEEIQPWSPRIQALCIMGGSALCWAVILTPVLLLL